MYISLRSYFYPAVIPNLIGNPVSSLLNVLPEVNKRMGEVLRQNPLPIHPRLLYTINAMTGLHKLLMHLISAR